MDDLLSEFLDETAENLDVVDRELVRFEQDPSNQDVLDTIFRAIHTIKGTCGFIGLPRLEALAHAAETVLGKIRDGKLTVTPSSVTLILEAIDQIKVILTHLESEAVEPDGDDVNLITCLLGVADGHGEDVPESAQTETVKARSVKSQTVRVTTDALDDLMTMVSELVLTRNQLLQTMRDSQDTDSHSPLQRLSSITAELQDNVMKTRLQPISTAWQKLPRLVRDIAVELDKKIDLQMQGDETELDRQVLELIKDPLTHMVRNACDHGLETADQRRAAGKSEQGTLRLSASHEGGHIFIDIADDGQGLDMSRIKEKVLEKGLATASEIQAMSEEALTTFIFHPGFSTAEAVSNVSGRGVGMDVVRANIEMIGGSVSVRSVPGQGTTFTIKIPLTLSIHNALVIGVGDEKFALPQLYVKELVQVGGQSEHNIEHIHNSAVLRLRETLLPVLSLSETLDVVTDEGIETHYVIVAQIREQQFGLIVDQVFDTEEIVVKPLSRLLQKLSVYSGCTILGDGHVVLILDPTAMVTAPGTAHADGVAA